ncbi:MAG: hypothetical protein D5R97_05030 [Candidatus Syntrophonatronum acetioxidans]|uniref:Uncharacterized protein n=1 Tax=Candidatus Syntrophonatronum acetioxidans TaxID=1795816 RepID=A0A424YET9_9FIRM|nr:MAG: hypothetical protein D5R97_05030 [Candidatus Syntrophonatronum acetioxidans]
MSKKKRKVKKGPQNPLLGKPVDKLLDVMLAEGFKDEVDPALEALKEKKTEAAEEIMKRIREQEEADRLTLYSEALAALCRDEDEYHKYIQEMEKEDPQKASLMLAGYWRVPLIKESRWIWDKIGKTIILDEKLLFYQLLMDRFLDTRAAQEGLYMVLKKNMIEHLPYFKRSLVQFLAFKGLSFLKEDIMEMPREEIIFLSGAWSEAWEKDFEELKGGETTYQPLGEEEMFKEQGDLLLAGVDKGPDAQMNVFLCINRSSPTQTELVMPYLDSPSWQVRFEAIYHFTPFNERVYMDKLWEVYNRENTTLEEQYAIISVLATCHLEQIIEDFMDILKDRSKPVSNRLAASSSLPLPPKEMLEKLSEDNPVIRWVNNLREMAQNEEEYFPIRFNCATILQEKLQEDPTEDWSTRDKLLFQVGQGEKVEPEKMTEYGLDLVEPLTYLHSYLQENVDATGTEVAILKSLGREVNDKLIEFARGEDVISRMNSIRLMTIFPEEKTADLLLEMLPRMIEDKKHMMVRIILQSLSFHQEQKIKIGDKLLELLKKEEEDGYVILCLITTLCALGQPRVLPLLFQLIDEGKVYGMSWEHMSRAVGGLCKDRPRALEIIEEKMGDEDNPYQSAFAKRVVWHLMQERNAAMRQQEAKE